MSFRRRAVTIAAAIAVAAAVPVSLLAMAGTAGAANPLQLATVTPGETATAGTPFSSGQVVTVNVPANSILSPVAGQNIVVVECAAPGGVDPSVPSACDPNSVSGDSLTPNADGSLSYSNYQLYSLPNAKAFGESPTGTPVCNLANQCVLYIGTNYGDFTQPHVWSQAFVINPTAGNTGANPGDGTPEVPLALGLPLLASGVVGGSVLYSRRRRRPTNAA